MFTKDKDGLDQNRCKEQEDVDQHDEDRKFQKWTH